MPIELAHLRERVPIPERTSWSEVSWILLEYSSRIERLEPGLHHVQKSVGSDTKVEVFKNVDGAEVSQSLAIIAP